MDSGQRTVVLIGTSDHQDFISRLCFEMEHLRQWVLIDNGLDKYDKVVLFPEKAARAKKVIGGTWLPKKALQTRI